LWSMIGASDRPGNCSVPGPQLPKSTSLSDLKTSTSCNTKRARISCRSRLCGRLQLYNLWDQTPPISLGTAAAAPAPQTKLFSILDSRSQCASSSWKGTASAGVCTTNTL
jgi:hypothetical protein